MNSVSNSQLSVQIKSHVLVVTKTEAGIERTLCVLDLRQRLSFYLNLGRVACRDAQGGDFTLATESPNEANELLTMLMDAQVAHRIQRLWRRQAQFVVALVGFAALATWGAWFITHTPHVALDQPSLTTSPAAPASIPAAKPSMATSVLPMVQTLPPQQPAFSPATAPIANGWTLPESVQKSLPEKLHKAAERKFFTVDYSSGHARTLYVFADPSCPNCQRVEPLLQGASSQYNVVVFPVSVIGREQSVAAITPVLCLPPEQRKAAWITLFDVGHEGLEIGKEKPTSETDADPTRCAEAQQALVVNEVAYQTYRIPGTPWVISDDGRHVSQALLSDPDRLQAFMSEQEPANAPK